MYFLKEDMEAQAIFYDDTAKITEKRKFAGYSKTEFEFLYSFPYKQTPTKKFLTLKNIIFTYKFFQ